ncbi:MAG: extracellular solute-binding protein [Lentisphaeria bacterium]|nr:extracellular solute-binding protein [Lentisphaeria bacterium]
MPNGTLTVYCAHDSVYAQAILDDFADRTGVDIRVKFDTEASKSLGLSQLIAREGDAPRCDVFWNNEIFGTIELAERGLLAPYKGDGFARIPPRFRDPAGFWTGFAGRFRVIIVNTRKAKAEQTVADKLLVEDPGRFAIAKPLFGTTFTHYTVLWSLWGEDRLKAWHADLRKRGIAEVLGNATVKNMVAKGLCDAGFTDTDDYFLAEDAGSEVAMLPVRVGDGHTICIPNTVAIVRGAPHPEQARKLVDFLLSAETEIALANSRSRQVPLGPVPPEALPEQVRRLQPLVKGSIPLQPLDKARAACLAWLKSEYAGVDSGQE